MSITDISTPVQGKESPKTFPQTHNLNLSKACAMLVAFLSIDTACETNKKMFDSKEALRLSEIEQLTAVLSKLETLEEKISLYNRLKNILGDEFEQILNCYDINKFKKYISDMLRSFVNDPFQDIEKCFEYITAQILDNQLDQVIKELEDLKAVYLKIIDFGIMDDNTCKYLSYGGLRSGLNRYKDSIKSMFAQNSGIVNDSLKNKLNELDKLIYDLKQIINQRKTLIKEAEARAKILAK